MVRSTARLRERPVLAAQIAALRTHLSDRGAAKNGSAQFARGALDALVWVTDGGPGPLTGAWAVVPVAWKLIVAELAAAEDIIYGRPSDHRDYARGMEHALMWAQRATAAPPLPPLPATTSAEHESVTARTPGRPR